MCWEPVQKARAVPSPSAHPGERAPVLPRHSELNLSIRRVEQARKVTAGSRGTQTAVFCKTKAARRQLEQRQRGSALSAPCAQRLAGKRPGNPQYYDTNQQFPQCQETWAEPRHWVPSHHCNRSGNKDRRVYSCRTPI